MNLSELITKRESLLVLAGLTIAVFLLFSESLGFLFHSDDWFLVGLPALARLVTDPFYPFKHFQGFGHFTPIAQIWFTLLSIFFREHPSPYHIVSLLLQGLMGGALFHLMRRFGIPLVGAIIGASYMTLSAANTTVLIGPTGHMYQLIGLLTVTFLFFWDQWALKGNPKQFALAISCAVVAPFIQTLGMLIIVIPILHRLLFKERYQADAPVFRSLAWMTLITTIFFLLPRVILPGGGGYFHPNYDPMNLLKGIGTGFEKLVLVNFSMDFLWPRLVLGGIAIVYCILTILRGGYSKIIILGGIIAILAYAIPLISLGWEGRVYGYKFRYIYVPNLGLALVFGGLMGAPRKIKNRIEKNASLLLAFVVGIIFLFFNGLRILDYEKILKVQDQYIRMVAENLKKTIDVMDQKESCSKVRLFDIPLWDSRPSWLNGNLLIQGLDHATLFNFYYCLDRKRMDRYSFHKYDPQLPPSFEECDYIIRMGQAVRKGA